MVASGQKFLITGATGFAGGRIAEFLRLKYPDADIKVTGRKTERKSHYERCGFSFASGDLSEPSFCESIVEEGAHIVHCAALSSPWGKERDFFRANVLSTSNLAEAAKRRKAGRFIYISSPTIYFNYKDRIGVKESDPLPAKPVNFYAASKLQAERLVLASGLFSISLRPRALIGRGDTVIFPRLLQAMEEGKIRIPGRGDCRIDLTGVKNLAHAVDCAINAPDRASGEAFNISAGEAVPVWECIAYFFKQIDKEFDPLRVPYPMAMLTAGVMEWYCRHFSGKEPLLTKYSVAMVSKNLSLNIEKARDYLGYTPVQSAREAVDEFIGWYRAGFPEIPCLVQALSRGE